MQTSNAGHAVSASVQQTRSVACGLPRRAISFMVSTLGKSSRLTRKIAHLVTHSATWTRHGRNHNTRSDQRQTVQSFGPRTPYRHLDPTLTSLAVSESPRTSSENETLESYSPFEYTSDGLISEPSNHYTDHSTDARSEDIASDDLPDTPERLERMQLGIDVRRTMRFRLQPTQQHAEDIIRYIQGPVWRTHERLTAESDEAPSLAATQNELHFNVMQWNVCGLHKKSALFHHRVHKDEVAIAMLQEVNVHYNPEFRPVEIDGYISTSDKCSKTAIYYRQDIPAIHIPLDLLSGGPSKSDVLYDTAIVVPLVRGNRKSNILFLNLYRPPKCKVSATRFMSYIEQARQWLKRHRPDAHFKDYVICGDLNASHQHWGARRGTNASNRAGKELYDLTKRHCDLRILNAKTKQVTRYRINEMEKLIKYSWIDVSICNQALFDHTEWWVRQLDCRSDHYQIFIQFDARCQQPPNHLMSHEETRWDIKDKAENWTTFKEMLCDKWEHVNQRIRTLQTDFRRERVDRLDDMATLIQGMYHQTAHTIFGRKTREHIWKKWIPKKAILHSIQFHHFYRRFVKKRHRTASDFRIYRAMRRKRDYWMSYYKRNWLAKKFRAQGIHGKGRWQVQNESRGINYCCGRDIPTLVDPNTGKTLAATTRAKVDLCNPYYHRHGIFTELKESWCFRHPECMPGPERFVRRSRIDDDECIEMEHDYDQPTLHPEIVREPGDEEDQKDREWRYTDWIAQRTRRRWLRCKKQHTKQLEMLNAPITRAEMRRAIGGFHNNKAQGPDELDIKFFKKTGDISCTVLSCYEYATSCLRSGRCYQGYGRNDGFAR